jgi:hypothetical protein
MTPMPGRLFEIVSKARNFFGPFLSTFMYLGRDFFTIFVNFFCTWVETFSQFLSTFMYLGRDFDTGIELGENK